MRIGIVGAGFAPGRTGGTEVLFRNLLSGLQAVDAANQYTVFVSPDLIPELRLSAPNFRAAPLRTRAPLTRRLVNRLLNRPRPGGLVPDPAMVATIDREGFDLVHFPLQMVNPWGVKSKKVVTFHDIQQEYWPQFFTPEKLEFRRQTYRPAAEAADHIIAISEYTKRTLAEKYGIADDRVTSVHLSYDEDLYENPARAPRIQLPPKYFFYPAAPWPHKNHDRLLDAFALVHKAHPEFRLVLSGMGVEQSDAVTDRVTKLALESAVVRIGYAASSELPTIYRNAFAFVFPSLFEGFGIPLCEAMASACPILASRTTSIPEVAGEAARYFDPMDANDIAAQMLWLIDHPSERAQLAVAGRHRASRFTSRAAARATVAVYEKVADR